MFSHSLIDWSDSIHSIWVRIERRLTILVFKQYPLQYFSQLKMEGLHMHAFSIHLLHVWRPNNNTLPADVIWDLIISGTWGKKSSTIVRKKVRNYNPIKLWITRWSKNWMQKLPVTFDMFLNKDNLIRKNYTSELNSCHRHTQKSRESPSVGFPDSEKPKTRNKRIRLWHHRLQTPEKGIFKSWNHTITSLSTQIKLSWLSHQL